MTSYAQAPTGLARRGRRLSDHETEQRMLRTAAAMVHRDGLTVSLDHISLEEVIRDADVSRSAVYRRWPYKDLFFSDLVKELARGATPEIVDDELALIKRIVAERLDWLDTPGRRHGLVIELLRQLAPFDFQALYGSARWRTYLALHATFLSLADGQLRDQIGEALARSERDHRIRVAHSWELLAGLFGYRLRPEPREGRTARPRGHSGLACPASIAAGRGQPTRRRPVTRPALRQRAYAGSAPPAGRSRGARSSAAPRARTGGRGPATPRPSPAAG
jgi:AcrR family transcriptional regulator